MSSRGPHQELVYHGQYFCVEYDHTAIVKRLHYRMQIDGYCWVFHIREGKFDAIREYIILPRLSWAFWWFSS